MNKIICGELKYDEKKYYFNFRNNILVIQPEKMEDYNKIFFESVDNLLKYRGIKAGDFEKDLGFRKDFIKRHLRKRSDCGFDNVMKISSKLGVPINVLTDSAFLDKVKMENSKKNH